MELKLNVMDYLLQAVTLYAAQKQTEKQRLSSEQRRIQADISAVFTPENMKV